jgi:apolipoprotein N-acyltransferase
VLFSRKGEIICRYDKLHLVPFGEYIPLRETFSFLETIVPIGDFTQGENYIIFKYQKENQKEDKTIKYKSINFSVLICFEDIFPELAYRFVNRGADFLVNITNDAWFKDSSEPYQHLAASVFRAVENRVNLVRAANTGISCFINPLGKITSKVIDRKGKDIFVSGYISDVISKNALLSLYTKYRDIFVLLCFILAGYGIITNSKEFLKKQKFNIKLKGIKDA